MADQVIKQGEDAVITLQVLDDNGQAIDLSGAYEVYAQLQVNNAPQQKFTTDTTGKPDYGEITIDTTNMKILVKREKSRNYTKGILKAVVVVSMSDVDLGVKHIEAEYVVGSVTDGYGKDETLKTS